MIALLAEAYEIAAAAHAGQRMRGPGDVPYVNHVCEVAALVARTGDDAEAVLAAVLHDTVEDEAITLDEIGERFGARVAELVEHLTDRPGWKDLKMPEKKKLQAKHLRDAPEAARRIKLADQTSNLRGVAASRWSKDRKRAYLEGAETVVAVCRGIDAELEAAFDAAARELRDRIGRGKGEGKA